uniref:Negative regulator of reactive oxygen species n=1 Tax=Sphenodon punctatus TaxID=8508 RepID=A0A8D0H7W0_SPHPU
MALIALHLFLGLIFQETQWGSKSGMAMAAYHSPCKLVHRAADCNWKQLSFIPVDLPAGTEELFLDSNTIQTLCNASLLQYRALQTLSLCENRLELIEPGTFLSSRELRILSLAGNSLFTNYSVTAAALQFLPALRQLDLSGNQLNEDMVATLIRNLSTLESLSVARNVIMRLDDSVFKSLTQLQELDLQSNYLYEIEAGTFEGLWRLQRLNLAYNHIPCIVEFDLTQLRVLNASNNFIEWFLAAENDAVFQLDTLDLSHNRLLFFPLLPRQSKLYSLLLMDNKISFYGNLSNNTSSLETTVLLFLMDGNVTNVTTLSLWEEVFLSNISSLSFLDISQNQLWYLPDGFLGRMPSLAHLKLDQNCLESLHVQESEPLGSLTSLDLSQNRLSDLQLHPGSGGILPNLIWFNLSANSLRGLPAKIFTHTKKITTVDLSYNQIDLCPQQANTDGAGYPVCIDFRNITSLQNLYLAGCDLKMVASHAFSGTSLTLLDLSNNQRALTRGLGPLQDIALTLQVLFLRNTSLSVAQIDLDFSDFRRLVKLDLSENSLAIFPKSLSGLALHTLDLRRNCLSTLPQDAVQKQLGKSLHVIYLSQNTYDCCKLEWWDILHGLGTVHIADRSQVTCNYSSSILNATRLSGSILHSCRWMTVDKALLYLLLALLPCLTLLVAFAVLFLTFKQQLLQMVKRRYRESGSY